MMFEWSEAAWPNAEHQDIHHNSMMPILPLGFPFSISRSEEVFFEILRQGNWHRAARMVVENQALIETTDQRRNGIFYYAARYITTQSRDER